MFTFRHCIQDILSSRQLTQVTGAPLYSYKLINSEYFRLQQSLMDSLRGKSIECYVSASMSSEWAGAFVMYAAEWWRKEFTGGHWSWDPLFRSLNVQEGEINASQRNRLIAAGFRFWRRPVLSNGQGRMFLGSVAIEGGLPLKLITDPNSKLANYFEQVIRNFGKFTLSKPNAVAIAQAHDHWIAASFRTEAVYTVVGSIAEVIYELTDTYGLDEQADPLRFLDAVAPNWTDKLPLSIETETAKGLLNTALGHAIAVQRRLPPSIRLVRRLSRKFDPHSYVIDDPSQVKESWCYRLSVSLRSRLNVQYVQQLFRMLTPPDRFNLFVLGKKPLLVAKAFRPKNNPERYLLDIFGTDMPEDWFDCEIQLMASCDDGQSWQAPLLGGSGLDVNELWVFAENEGEWVFEGAGDVSCESTKVLVSASTNGIPERLEGRIEDIGFVVMAPKNSISLSTESRTLRLLEGAGLYAIDGYDVMLGGEANNTEYVWEGDVLPYQTLPTKCFVGKPSLLAMSASGFPSEISRNSLLWHDASRAQWLPFETLPLGQSDVAYLENGKAKKRFKLASLPADFQISFIPSHQMNRGKIVFSSTRAPMVALSERDVERVECYVESENGSTIIELSAIDVQPPTIVELSLWWQERPKAIVLTLPFPSKGICLLDKHQNLVQRCSSLLIDKINQYELYGYGLEGGITIQFTLLARDVRGPFARSAYVNRYFSNLDAFSSGMSLSLFRTDIQSLLALSANLDTKVNVSVIHLSQEIYAFSFAHYEHYLVPERELRKLSISAGQDKITSDCRICTISLERPDQMPRVLESTRVSDPLNMHAWTFPDQEVEAGAWLVYCDDLKFGVRPLMWSKGFESLRKPNNDLEKAAGIGRGEDRLVAFGDVAKDMAYDFKRAEWKYVRTLLSFTHVPLTTFDLWRGATRHPEFLLALLLNANKTEIDQVWEMDKQFPVLWSSLKINIASKVITAFYNNLIEKLGEDLKEVAQSRVEKKLSELVSYYPSLESLAAMMKYKVGIIEMKPSLAPPAYMQHVYDCRNALSQRQLDASWPSIFAQDVLKSVIRNVNPQLSQMCITANYGFKNNVMNAPSLLALATSGQAELSITPEVVHAMREYRRFDPEYFDECFSLTQKMIIGLVDV